MPCIGPRQDERGSASVHQRFVMVRARYVGTNIPGIGSQYQDFLKGIDSLRIHSLGGVNVRQLCPGLGVHGAKVQER